MGVSFIQALWHGQRWYSYFSNFYFKTSSLLLFWGLFSCSFSYSLPWKFSSSICIAFLYIFQGCAFLLSFTLAIFHSLWFQFVSPTSMCPKPLPWVFWNFPLGFLFKVRFCKKSCIVSKFLDAREFLFLALLIIFNPR